MRLLPISIVIATLALSGCATILAGGPDNIPVQTNVPGASVFVDDVLVGQTPMVVVLDREKSQGRIRIEAPGYQPVVLQRAKSINGWFWGNLCLGGLVGMVIDAVTGNIKKFDDGPLNVALTPLPGGPQYAPPPAGYPPPAAPPYAPPPAGYPPPGM